jgi:hypothetical protein
LSSEHYKEIIESVEINLSHLIIKTDNKMNNRRTTLGPISQSTANSRAGQLSRPSIGPSRTSNAADGFPLKLPRQSLAGPPTASRVSFGGNNMGGNMMAKKSVAPASR